MAYSSIRHRNPVRALAQLAFITLLALICRDVIAQEVNPLANDARAGYAGAALFRAQCATCHGADARGIDSIDAPDLTLLGADQVRSDQALFTTIRDGVPGTIMPPHDYTDTELWMLVTYLRSIAQRGVAELPAGDSDRGREMFGQLCAECHRVGSRGGILGPALTQLLSRQTLAAIELAVRQPNANVSSDYRTVEIETTDGNHVTGVLRNIDAFSVQLVSREQQLLAIQQSHISTLVRPEVSLMPAFDEAMLSRQQLLDILNFIRTERDGDSQ